MSKLQDNIDSILEQEQAKVYNEDFLAKKVALEAENELLTLEVNNYNLKYNLAQAKQAYQSSLGLTVK